MASCPGDWNLTGQPLLLEAQTVHALCALVVPHTSAACTTVTRLHGVTSQNRAILKNNYVTICSSARHITQFCIPVSYIQAADFKTGVLKGIATCVSRSCVKLLCSTSAPKCSIETHCSHLRHTFAPVSICKMNISCLSSTARIYAILGASCTIEPIPVALRVCGNREFETLSEGSDFRVLCLLCAVPLRRADHSCCGVQLGVSNCEGSRDINNEAA